MFKIGQKVARIGGTSLRCAVISVPEIGEPCTVISSYINPSDDEPCIELAEYPMPAGGRFLAGFYAKYFRRVVETDVSIFTALLTPTPARSRELCGSR